MRDRLFTFGIALFLFSILVGDALAGRTPMRRVPRVRTRGAKPAISVPYITNGRSNFGVWNGVSPRIYSAPQVDNKTNPGARRVYNIPFYGSKMGFSGRANGARPIKKLIPQPIFR